MRVIARRTLLEFVESLRGHKDQPAVSAVLQAWFHEAKMARWSSAQDIKRHYATVGIVASDRVVFNIKGNDYRLVCAVDFEKQIIWIKWLGTHRDYDHIDVRTVSYGS
jgi:mRNA interferase HigB